MEASKIWKLRYSIERENAIRDISEKLKLNGFSDVVDTALLLAKDRLKEKDEVRRDIQGKLSRFKFIPEDFVWK